MNDSVEIRSSQFRYNMSVWCTEKAENVLSALARLIEELPRNESDDRALTDLLLATAVHDTTKLLAFGSGAEWSVDDPSLVLDNGYKGFEQLLVKYRILEETSEAAAHRKLTLFLRQFESLLEGQRAPNRTLIHELLRSVYISDPIVRQLADLTEAVTMGETDWPSFVASAREVIQGFRSTNS